MIHEDPDFWVVKWYACSLPTIHIWMPFSFKEWSNCLPSNTYIHTYGWEWGRSQNLNVANVVKWQVEQETMYRILSSKDFVLGCHSFVFFTYLGHWKLQIQYMYISGQICSRYLFTVALVNIWILNPDLAL